MTTANSIETAACYTMSQAAKLLNLSYSSVSKMVQKGTIRSARPNMAPRIPHSEIVRLSTPTK